MRRKQVGEVIVPLDGVTKPVPSVRFRDSLVDAVEKMSEHGLDRIAVVRGGEPIGMIRLEDALRALGLLDRA